MNDDDQNQNIDEDKFAPEQFTDEAVEERLRLAGVKKPITEDGSAFTGKKAFTDAAHLHDVVENKDPNDLSGDSDLPIFEENDENPDLRRTDQ